MTLQEAIEEIKSLGEEADWLPQDVAVDREVDVIDQAIATILNAVVKGELRTQPESRQPILDRFAIRNGHNAQRPDESREAYNMRVYGLREEDME